MFPSRSYFTSLYFSYIIDQQLQYSQDKRQIIKMNSYQQSQDRKQSNHNILAHQLKEANLQLKECQAQPFIMDYMHQVIQPNSIYLVIYAILAYFLYILIELFMYNVQSLTTVENQRNHLINLHNYFSIDRENKIDNARIFVDMYRQVFNLNYDNLSSSTPCNQSRYYCKQTSNSSLQNSVEFGYNTIRKNYQFLIQSTNSKLDGQVFLYNPDWNDSLLIYKLEQYKQFLVADQLLSYLQKQRSTAYYKLTIKKIISEESYLIKILFCGRLPLLNPFARICVVTPGSLQQQVMEKENPIKLVDSTIVTVTSSSIQSKSLDKVNIVNTFLKEAIYKYIDLQDQQFYMSFPFEECINEYYVKQYYAKNKIKICSPPQILYLMTPLTIFINFNIQISAKYYYEDMLNSGVQNQYSQKLNFLILSNQTFMQNEGLKLKNNNLKQSYVSILLIVTTVVWVLMMSYLPLKLIGGDLALSVSLMIKLCKAVKQIRNKDDLEQQIDIFNKLNIQINKKDHIFYQTIEYFKYFIWYRKWVFATKNRKKKSILDEGLTLFGSSDFAPVLMYIYKKQIERQTKLVQNYKKMRRIFTQKFMIFQSYDKIEACLHNQKSRIAGQNKKKSGFSKSQIELDQDCVYGRDFCMIQNVENRINKQLQFLQIQKKSKRNVRFSNDRQQEQKPFQYKMSKFVLNLPSQSSIQKNSLKSIEEQIKRKEEKQLQAVSNAVQSSREQRLFNQIRDQESQKSQRKEELENWNMFLKFDQTDEQNSFDAQQDQCFELKRYSLKKLQQKVGETYEILFRAYQKMIVIKKMYLDKQQVYQIEEYINELYKMQIQKLRYAYKYMKHRNNERQKILKQLSRKLILVKKQKINLKDIEQDKKQKLVGSEKWLQENISIIEDQVFQETKLIDVQFKQFIVLEEKYKIDPFLIDKAKICQIKILKVLNYPIPYKKLQNLCDSTNEYIRVEARAIMAAQFFNISPHADVQVLEKVQQNLSENQTTHQQKQKTLRLLKKVIENRDNMQAQEIEIQLIKNFYNYSHKKFYFVVDLSDNYEVFEPTINEIYKNMGTVDMYQILNLAMNENAQDMIASGNEIKPSKLCDFQIKFKNIHTEANKIKSMASAKTGSRKMAYQKDFNRILSKIEQEDIDLSKFIVIILGGQNELQSRTHEDHQSSSAQNRQVYQIIHQQILSKMQKNYFHVILVGYNLKDYQTKQGKLKKYAKHSYSLIEIDLSKLNIEVMHKQLGKFLDK